MEKFKLKLKFVTNVSRQESWKKENAAFAALFCERLNRIKHPALVETFPRKGMGELDMGVC